MSRFTITFLNYAEPKLNHDVTRQPLPPPSNDNDSESISDNKSANRIMNDSQQAHCDIDLTNQTNVPYELVACSQLMVNANSFIAGFIFYHYFYYLLIATAGRGNTFSFRHPHSWHFSFVVLFVDSQQIIHQYVNETWRHRIVSTKIIRNYLFFDWRLWQHVSSIHRGRVGCSKKKRGFGWAAWLLIFWQKKFCGNWLQTLRL